MDSLQETNAPVAWIYSYEDTHAVELKRYPDDEVVEGCLITPLYTTPTAAIEDFKRRAIEAAVYVVEVEDELIVKNAIAALPLIEEK